MAASRSRGQIGFTGIITLLCLLGDGSGMLAAQADPKACDENLKRLASPVNGYQARGDRCEGLYARQVSGTALFLASFTQRFDALDGNGTDSLIVSWPSYGNVPLNIRAETIRGGRFYRMDTQRSLGDTLFRWSKRVLSAERINRNDLGVRSWMKVQVGAETRNVYLPLQLTQKVPAPGCGNLEIVLAAGQRLREVRIGLVRLGPDGLAAESIRTDEPLRRGFYPAGVPIVVSLKPAEFPDAGIYRLTTAADLFPSGIVTRTELLYIPSMSRCPS